MLGYDYPLLDLFLTMVWVVLFVVWIMLLLQVFGDIFRSHDLGGFAKALWIIFVVVLPYLGVFVYLLARGRQMTARRVADAQANDAAVRDYIRDAAGTASPAAELGQLADLRDRGVISEAEFQAGKAKILS